MSVQISERLNCDSVYVRYKDQAKKRQIHN